MSIHFRKQFCYAQVRQLKLDGRFCRGQLVFDNAGENVAEVDILVNNAVYVQVMNGLKETSGNGHEPVWASESLDGEKLPERAEAAFSDDAEGIPKLKRVVDIGYVGMPQGQ